MTFDITAEYIGAILGGVFIAFEVVKKWKIRHDNNSDENSDRLSSNTDHSPPSNQQLGISTPSNFKDQPNIYYTSSDIDKLLELTKKELEINYRGKILELKIELQQFILTEIEKRGGVGSVRYDNSEIESMIRETIIDVMSKKNGVMDEEDKK